MRFGGGGGRGVKGQKAPNTLVCRSKPNFFSPEEAQGSTNSGSGKIQSAVFPSLWLFAGLAARAVVKLASQR
jgi:hypothetical protein